MQTENYISHKVLTAKNIITGNTEVLSFRDGRLVGVQETETATDDLSFIGPGLIDLQINGINGIDFNNPSVTQQDIIKATHYLLSKGVTTFLPAVITNSDAKILQMVRTIYGACLSDPLVNECIWGIHLEGPFISPEPGAKGAHDQNHIKAPDWDLFTKFQEACGGRIKLITLAPEWDDAPGFIEKCKAHGVIVSIGHSMANSRQIRKAVKAGATMSTHLGNAVPLLLPRHPNIIWDQLAADELYACIIADGIHIPESFIKVVMKSKGKATILVSDATCFAGMPPGEYENHIGGTVIVDEDKRISLKSSPGLLAGAAKSLLENVEYLITHHLSTLKESWMMASENAATLLAGKAGGFNNKNDKVVFKVAENEIRIETVIKNGKIVFEK